MASRNSRRRAAGKAKGAALPDLYGERVDGVTLRYHRDGAGVLVEVAGRDRGNRQRASHDEIGRVDVFDGVRRVQASGIVTTLDRLLSSGAITKAEYLAGCHLAAQYEMAHIEALGSCLGSVDRVSGGEGGRVGHITEAVRAAKAELEAIVQILGGYESRGCRAVLDIAGLNLSLRSHVAKQRAYEGRGGYSVEMARGIIPAMLGVLATVLRLNNDR
jgi:hypothetical protein